MLSNQMDTRLRDVRVYGDVECLDVKHIHCGWGSDADEGCLNCFYVRAIEGILHERQYNDYDPNFIGLRYRGNFIASSCDGSYWEVIESEETIPNLPYNIFYNGTFCRIYFIEDDNIFYQANEDDDYEYYAIFKIVRQRNFNKLKRYVNVNKHFVKKFSYSYMGKDDRGGKIYSVFVVIHKNIIANSSTD